MKIAVINGSPKGKYSITLQTIRYLERKFPDHEFLTLHAGQKIKALEKDFTPAMELLASADAVIFSYPVYTFLAPSQLHRFIELLKASGLDMTDKYATQITTSKHFYDVTAHKYVEENALDLGMRYIRGLSADMEDLLTEGGRSDAEKFFVRFLWSVEEGVFTRQESKPEVFVPVAASVPDPEASEKKQRDVVIITDVTDQESNLARMTQRFRHVFGYTTRVVNISDYPFSGGCLGCFRCAVSEKCMYKDDFDSFLRENIQKADAIVYAFTVRDHSMGARFKMYDDRNFCNGHRTVTVGMPVGYIVSGPYAKEHNLRTVIEGRSETGGNFLSGVATDERDADTAALTNRFKYRLIVPEMEKFPKVLGVCRNIHVFRFKPTILLNRLVVSAIDADVAAIDFHSFLLTGLSLYVQQHQCCQNNRQRDPLVFL